jgi:DNA-binding MarR family transcriptional regulator
MAAGPERAWRRADASGVSFVSITAWPGVAVGHNAEVVTAEDVDWLVAHLRVVVAASPALWAGRGVTLLQLSALYLISALAPVTVSGLAQSLGTKAAATSVMVARLAHAGLVCSTPDPQDRRRVQLTLTAKAEPIVGDTDLDTAHRLQAVLKGISSQTRRHLIDILVDTIRRSAEYPRDGTRRPRRTTGDHRVSQAGGTPRPPC